MHKAASILHAWSQSDMPGAWAFEANVRLEGLLQLLTLLMYGVQCGMESHQPAHAGVCLR